MSQPRPITKERGMKIFDKIIDWTIDSPGWTVIILLAILVILAFVSAWLGIEPQGGFPIIIFM
jgi:hypothetical protein